MRLCFRHQHFLPPLPRLSDMREEKARKAKLRGMEVVVLFFHVVRLSNISTR